MAVACSTQAGPTTTLIGVNRGRREFIWCSYDDSLRPCERAVYRHPCNGGMFRTRLRTMIDYKALKEAYDKAVEANQEVSMFEGVEILTKYAYYLLMYLEKAWKSSFKKSQPSPS